MAERLRPPSFAARPADLLRMCRTLLDAGEGAKAVALAEDMVRRDPGNRDLLEVQAFVATRHVPGFHLDILADAARNAVYARAIESALAGGETVLDIGAGSGLLAMIAARSGAASVTACEVQPALADTARQIVARNGYGDVVKVIAKHSTRVDRDKDLGGPAEVIIHEIFSDDVIGEGVLPAVSDAVARLAAPDAKILPARAAVRVAAAHFAHRRQAPVAAVLDLDLSLFNRHVGLARKIPVSDDRLVLRSAAADIFTFDFARPATLAPAAASVEVIATGGPVNGVAQWIVFDFATGERYENRPGPCAASHWQVIFTPLAAEVETAPGEAIRIRGLHDQMTMRLRVEV